MIKINNLFFGEIPMKHVICLVSLFIFNSFLVGANKAVISKSYKDVVHNETQESLVSAQRKLKDIEKALRKKALVVVKTQKYIEKLEKNKAETLAAIALIQQKAAAAKLAQLEQEKSVLEAHKKAQLTTLEQEIENLKKQIPHYQVITVEEPPRSEFELISAQQEGIPSIPAIITPKPAAVGMSEIHTTNENQPDARPHEMKKSVENQTKGSDAMTTKSWWPFA